MPYIQMLLKIDEELHAKIKAEAELQVRSFAGQVRFILTDFINKEDEKNKQWYEKNKEELKNWKTN